MPYVRVALNGTLASGIERWSCGWCYNAYDTYADAFALFGILQDAADRVVGFLTQEEPPILSLLAALGSSGAITDVTVQQRLSTGLLEMGASAELATPISGTGSSAAPISTAIVVSTSTGMPGGSYRGRIFWPAPSAAIQVSGRIGSADQEGVAADMAALIDGVRQALNDAAPEEVVQPIVWSKRLQTGQLMRSVSVGDVPDVLRRRRDALVETRVSVPVVAA